MSYLADEIDREYRLKNIYNKKKERICNLKCDECKLYNNCELKDKEVSIH